MHAEFCPQESRIAEALQQGCVSGEMEAHAGQCAVCGEALLIAQFLAADEPGPAPPPAGLVYWKAELRARREQAELALLPARRMQLAAMVALPAVAIASVAMPGGPKWIAGAVCGFALLLATAGWAIRRWLVRAP